MPPCRGGDLASDRALVALLELPPELSWPEPLMTDSWPEPLLPEEVADAPPV